MGDDRQVPQEQTSKIAIRHFTRYLFIKVSFYPEYIIKSECETFRQRNLNLRRCAGACNTFNVSLLFFFQRKSLRSVTSILWARESSSLTDRREYSRIYLDFTGRINIRIKIIVGLIRKGELHLTESVCPRDFLGELEYWGLSALHQF